MDAGQAPARAAPRPGTVAAPWLHLAVVTRPEGSPAGSAIADVVVGLVGYG